jgi:hypothetical protein
MPETVGGVPVDQPKFSKPPAGGELLSQDDLKRLSEENKAVVAEVADVLGGRVLGADEAKIRKDAIVSHDEDPDLADVDADDRKEFIRTLLSGVKFTKKYTIFGGVIELTFNTRTSGDNKSISDAAVNPTDREARRMGASLAAARFDGNETEFPNGFDGLSDVVYAAMLKEFRKFEKLCDLLFKKADDPNFWTEIGGPS